MEYTVKEIAEQTDTYKVKVERYIKANDIKPKYIDGGRKTKYYDEQTLLDYVGYINFKEQEKNETTRTDTTTLENALELRNKVSLLSDEVSNYKELITNQNALIEQLSNENNERIQDLKDGIEILKTELRTKDIQQEKQNQTIETLLNQNKMLLELLEQSQQKPQEEAIQPTATEHLPEAETPRKRAKKGILERIFKHE